MARRVEFVDTSVLCNLLEIPGKCQDRAKVVEQFQQKLSAPPCDLLLPMTAVIETGNHIATRQQRAQVPGVPLDLVECPGGLALGDHPQEFSEPRGAASARAAVGELGRTGSSMVEHACNRLGCGDLNILVERDRYLDRTSGVEAGVWTLDELLSSYA